MQTEYIRINTDNIDEEKINRAAGILRAGGMVAFPTETVYGLGANAYSAEASSKIYAAKGRPSDNPLIVHIADRSELNEIAQSVPEHAEKLMAAFWPGPMTLVFRKKPIVPDTTTGGLDTVAVRMPSQPVAAALIRACGFPVAAPSANTSGRPSPTMAEHVRQDLDGRIEMIIDGGPCSVGLESTIIDVTGTVPMLLRPGHISLEEIRTVAGECLIDPAIIGRPDPSLKPKAPGMAYRHYAPRGQMAIVEGDTEAVIRKINALAQEAKRNDQLCAVICAAENAGRYRADLVMSVGEKDDDEKIARNLFAVLRDLDEKKAQLIYAECFSGGSSGMAIMNRMLKAAGYNEIQA